MKREFTSVELSSARRTELYDFLLTHHSDKVKKVGNTLLLKSNPSVKVKKGYYGYTDYQTRERSHSIEYLMRYFNYSFEEAVIALLNYKGGEA